MNANRARPRIWIDLDNSPHVPFFRPIVDELTRRGCEVYLTARDAFQVQELARLHRLQCVTIGRHFGKNPMMKIVGLIVRTLQLLPFAIRARPGLAVSHGSRAQAVASKLLRIPSVIIADYEHVTHVTRPEFLIVPQTFPSHIARSLAKEVIEYPGIKEDVYAYAFRADPSIKAKLGLNDNDIVVIVRPPATEAHYHNPDSERLFAAVLTRLCATDGVRTVLLPRNARQQAEITAQWGADVSARRIIIPREAVEGLSLVWSSDLVISGGGTMNREAAALGVPVYSIFRGQIGAVDRQLAREARLTLIETPEDVYQKIALVKRIRGPGLEARNRSALDTIVNGIVRALGQDAGVAVADSVVHPNAPSIGSS